MTRMSLLKEHGNRALTLLALFFGASAILLIWLWQDIELTTSLMLALPVVGIACRETRIFIAALIALLLGWTLVVASLGWPAPALHFSVALGAAGLLAAFLHRLQHESLAREGELKSMSEALKRSDQQARSGETVLRSLLRNVPAGIIVYGSDRRIQFINRNALDLLDKKEGSYVGRMPGEIGWELSDIGGKLIPEEAYPVNRIFAGEKSVVNELFSLGRSDGRQTYLLVTAFQIQREGDDPMVISTFIDVTERIEAERRLRENENFSRAILNSIADGVIAVDERDYITHFNPGAQRMIGFSRDEAIGRPLSEVFRFQEDKVKSNIAFSQGYVTARNDKSTFVQLLTAELVDRSGVHLGNVLTFRDMTEQLRTEQQRSTLDKMASVGVLAGGIAHDFNNLLVGLYGNVSVAQESAGENAEIRQHLDKAMESLDQATRLTRQLLTFATGSDPVRRQESVEALVREVTRFSMSGSSVVVEYEFDPEVWDIEVDREQIHQALSCVLINAKQAMDDKGTVRITAANRYNMARSVLLKPGSYVEIVVRDDGPGIEPEVMSRIFDPYFSTRSTGTGLGLATAHSIVAKHGGTVAVDSIPGEGATFSIYLPAVSRTLADEASVIDEGSVALTARHILVLDDEEIVLDTLQRMLTFLGHRMVAVKDGAEAIRLYGQHFHGDDPFDCVITDLTIVGGMGGSQAAAGILEIDPQAILIVSSGYSAGAEMANYAAFGFTDVLEKPFGLDDLRRTLSRAFSGSSQT